MNFKTWVAFGTLLSAALGVQAQQASRTPDPADPLVAVPAIVYVSVMNGHTLAGNDSKSPDKVWRGANETVAGQSGHAGHHSQPSEPRKDDAQRSAEPAGATQDHHKHH